jgi:drug/metabolite transporter (DMT)-like permease
VTASAGDTGSSVAAPGSSRQLTGAAGRGQRAFAAAEPRTRGLIAIALSCLILSAGSTMVKKTGVPGPVVAFWRLWVAAVLWSIYLVVTKGRLTLKTFVRLTPVGAVYGINFALFFTAARMTRIANVEFIGTLTPVVLIPVSVVFLKERISSRIVAAGAVALVGVAMVLFFAPKQSGQNNWTGNIICFFAIMSWAGYLLLIRKARQQFSTSQLMACMTMVAAVVVTPIGLSTGKAFDLSTKAMVLILFMSISNGMIAHSLIAWSQGKVPVATIALMQLSQPVLAVVWAYLIVNESVRAIQLLGMAIVLIAVAIIGLETARRQPQAATTISRPADDEVTEQ